MRLLLSFIPLLWAMVAPHPCTMEEESEVPAKCGYASCPTPIPGKLNVHLVPHTHDDVGWLKTVDQYYYGSRTRIQNAGVQYILDSVIEELSHDPKKKFIYVELAFFWKWWMEQGDHMRHKVKKLVANGQLEFIGGAWSMNDEATTHYQSVVDQFTWGFRKLNDTFGYCGQPKVGWQIDPFGHARETASMMAQMGFDGLFFGRLDYEDKNTRLRNKTMEMIWEGSDSLGTQSDLFTGALYNEYSSPPGFCFDVLCDDEPIIDNPKSSNYNVDERVDAFVAYVRNQSRGYDTDNILVTMGEDFQYQSAHINYKNLDRLIRYVNERQKNGSDVNVFYSTPSCYLKSLNDADTFWPTKSDDFFPYSSDPHAFWTGYFTSRPTLKYFERLGNNYLQICKQLSAITSLGPDYDHELNEMREAMGIMQHHDAITGTEKQHVADDYSRILTKAFGQCGKVINDAVNRIARTDSKIPNLNMTSCLLSNISECALSANNDKFIVTVYNPLSRPVNYFVRLPVSQLSWSVLDPKGDEIETQIVPIPKSLVGIPGRKSKTQHELIFKAKDVPPLGYKAYFVSVTNETVDNAETNSTEEATLPPIEDEEFSVNMTSDGITLGFNSSQLNVKLSAHFYIGEAGNNVNTGRSSGAYIFRPRGTEPTEMKSNDNDIVYTGSLVQEVHHVYSDWASSVVRRYENEPYVEVEWLVGPIPVNDKLGREAILRYTTPEIDNNGTFYTDSSGRESIKRVKDHRPTWDLNLHEKVSGNYYPITTDISINNSELELSVITDRAQGGTSLNPGQIEVMVHRRLLHDDGFGVDEALNEVAFGTGLIARGRHWVVAGSKSDPEWPKRKRHLQQEKVLNSQVLLAVPGSMDFDAWSKSYKLEFSALTEALPENVQILTLEPWGKSTFLLRLEHIYEKRESTEEAFVNLNNLFVSFDIVSIRETTLGANQWLDEATRLKWKKETNEVTEEMEEETNRRERRTASMKIKLRPKEIRTFICQIKPKMFV